jgi:hypothetical protein
VFINVIRMSVGYLDGVTTALSKYALVYAGLTGTGFWESARRGRALTDAAGADKARGKGGRIRTKRLASERKSIQSSLLLLYRISFLTNPPPQLPSGPSLSPHSSFPYPQP